MPRSNLTCAVLSPARLRRGLHRTGLLILLAAVILAGCTVRSNVPPSPAEAVLTPTPVSVPTTATPATAVSASPLAQPAAPVVTTPRRYSYRIVNTYPHDLRAFTQGLLYADGVFYEGTGQYGASSLRRVMPESGQVEQMATLPDDLFGEGIVLVDDRIIQLTWQAGLALVVDKESFTLLETFTYPTEGWGITYDGERLIMSDGSDTLFFRDPRTFDEMGRVQVQDGGAPVNRLNELEYVNGLVYANVWMTDRIAQIDPATGAVVGWIDLSGLLDEEARNEMVAGLTAAGVTAQYVASNAVLNGIAYDAQEDRLFVTGKYWPRLFEIELVDETGS